MVTERKTSPYLDHDTMLFVLEELIEAQQRTRAQQRIAMSKDEYQIAARHFFECSAFSRFGDRLVAAYKERGVPTP